MATICRLILAVVVLALTASCGGSGYSSPTMPTPSSGNGTPVSIPSGARTMGSAAYAPNPVTVTAGSAVTWKNNDTIPHTATSDTSLFNSGSIAPGASYSYTFQTKGTYSYHCTAHPGMVASVVVQ